MTYWALGGNGMAGVEYLTDVGQIRPHAYFLFAPVKIRGGSRRTRAGARDRLSLVHGESV